MPNNPLSKLTPHVTRRELASLLDSSEAFELFRAIDNELFVSHGEAPISIGVISALASEGRTSISVLLATLAAAYSPQRKVLLLDGNLSQPSFPGILDFVAAGPGLIDYCDDGRSFAECVQKTPLANLDVVSGGTSKWQFNKLSQPGLTRFLADAKKHYQLIVVDTPPSGSNRDVVLMGKLLDTLLLVVRYGYATREQIQPVVAALKQENVSILGAVMNQRIFPIPHLLYGK